MALSDECGQQQRVREANGEKKSCASLLFYIDGSDVVCEIHGEKESVIEMKEKVHVTL